MLLNAIGAIKNARIVDYLHGFIFRKYYYFLTYYLCLLFLLIFLSLLLKYVINFSFIAYISYFSILQIYMQFWFTRFLFWYHFGILFTTFQFMTVKLKMLIFQNRSKYRKYFLCLLKNFSSNSAQYWCKFEKSLNVQCKCYSINKMCINFYQSTTFACNFANSSMSKICTTINSHSNI